MATFAATMQTPRVKAMVVPREHGAWGMLLVPLATGAIVAARLKIDPLALMFFVVVALGCFWVRTPVEAWLGTSVIKVRTGQERTIVLRVAIVLVLVVTAAIIALFELGYSHGLLLIGAVGALSFALQALVKQLGRNGRMPAQMIGAVGLTSTAAGAYYVSTAHLNCLAVALWVANWLFAINQVHFVQLRIHASRASSVSEKLRQGHAFLLAQLGLLIVIALLTWSGLFPRFAAIAFAPAIFRGTGWFLRGQQPLDVHKLGFSELFQSILFGTLLCVFLA